MRRKAEKKFDAVATMREIRARLSRQIEDMTFEEEKRYILERRAQGTVRYSGKPPAKELPPASLPRGRGTQRRTALLASRGRPTS